MLEAHEHSYERLYPVYNGTVMGTSYTNPNAMIHIVSGQAGCNEDNGICVNPIFSWQQGPWSAKYFWLPWMSSYAKLKVHNGTHLHYILMDDFDGNVLDDLWIVQDSHGPRTQPEEASAVFTQIIV